MYYDGPGFGGPFGHLIVLILSGVFTIFVILVIIGLLFVLVRFLLVGTKAAQLYIEKNGPTTTAAKAMPVAPSNPAPAAATPVTKPVTKPRTPPKTP